MYEICFKTYTKTYSICQAINGFDNMTSMYCVVQISTEVSMLASQQWPVPVQGFMASGVNTNIPQYFALTGQTANSTANSAKCSTVSSSQHRFMLVTGSPLFDLHMISTGDQLLHTAPYYTAHCGTDSIYFLPTMDYRVL